MTTTSLRRDSDDLPTAWRIPVATLLGGIVVLAVALLQEVVVPALELNRDALLRGELHRLLTGHLTHFNNSHLLWDLVVFVALGAWVEQRSRPAWWGTVIGSALVIGLGILVLQPELAVYRGLSGVDSALFAFIATSTIRRRGPASWLGVSALVALLVKSACEWASGTAIFAELEDVGAVAVPLAHLLGGVVGAVVALGHTYLPSRRARAAAGAGASPDVSAPGVPRARSAASLRRWTPSASRSTSELRSSGTSRSSAA